MCVCVHLMFISTLARNYLWVCLLRCLTALTDLGVHREQEIVGCFPAMLGDLKTDTLVPNLPDAWHYRVNTGTG